MKLPLAGMEKKIDMSFTAILCTEMGSEFQMFFSDKANRLT